MACPRAVSSDMKREPRVGGNGVPMAEKCTVAFGRYLRMLRERRGLSLDEVASMSRSLADPVHKGYLSRCENGRHGVGFSKVVTLARVYNVPFEVLAERMELDTELDRLGGIATDGMSYAEMQKKAHGLLNRGHFWDAYALLRDSLPMAASAPVSRSFVDSREQLACACMNLSTAAGRLERSHFALHELEFVHASGHVTERHLPALLDLLSWRCRVIGDIARAKRFATDALARAEAGGTSAYLGFCLANRARLAIEEEQFREAIAFYQRADKAFNDAQLNDERARTLLNIAGAYLSLGQFGSARRTGLAAERLAASIQQVRVQTLVRLLLGTVEDQEGKSKRAIECWHEAVELARSARDKVLLFKALHSIYRHYVERGQETLATPLRGRIRRLAAWLPPDFVEADEFRLRPSSRERAAARVARAQHRTSDICNA